MSQGPYQKILLAVDGSSHSMKAARQAIGLAKACGGEIVLVHARKRIPDFLGEPYYQSMLDRLREQTEGMLEPFRAELAKADVAWDVRVLEGDPAEAVCTVAQVEGCDLVVMGTRGLTDLEGLFLGSVAHKILHTAPCPVLTVR